jgi:hypothetical protein
MNYQWIDDIIVGHNAAASYVCYFSGKTTSVMLLMNQLLLVSCRHEGGEAAPRVGRSSLLSIITDGGGHPI